MAALAQPLANVPGWGATLSRRAEVRFGRELPSVLRDDPYRLAELPGIGFKLADAAALHFGMDRRSPVRQAAAAVYVLAEAEQDGHTALPVAEFGVRVTEALGEALRGCEFDERVTERDGLMSRTKTLHAEERAAVLVKAMLSRPAPRDLPILCNGLAEDQVAALTAIQHANIFCLLGSPGTGKTTLVRSLAESNPNVQIAYCAPTGKAAKRLEEATGQPARTVHRLLEAGIDSRTGKFRFRRNASNRLSCGIVVCDEASMLDIWLFNALLEALADDCRLVLVGDIYQLPSVGPGRVLADLTKNGAVPNVELTQLKRHDPDLLIAKNCAQIKAGLTPVIANAAAKDFFFMEVPGNDGSEMRIADLVVSLAAERLPAKYGADPNRDIVVLTALRERGLLSAKHLNAQLRIRNNTESAQAFAPGDRVIQLSNNYDLDVMNGDIGTVVRSDGRNLVVRFDTPERLVTEDKPDAALNLAHGWALTVHKAQGSEWEWVVIPIHESQGAMVPDRAWLYTAISRAKQGCVLVGSKGAMQAMIQRVRPQMRWTRLANLLQRD
jgi:exodeoxyribonuclease V alpha subunit